MNIIAKYERRGYDDVQVHEFQDSAVIMRCSTCKCVDNIRIINAPTRYPNHVYTVCTKKQCLRECYASILHFLQNSQESCRINGFCYYTIPCKIPSEIGEPIGGWCVEEVKFDFLAISHVIVREEKSNWHKVLTVKKFRELNEDVWEAVEDRACNMLKDIFDSFDEISKECPDPVHETP